VNSSDLAKAALASGKSGPDPDAASENAEEAEYSPARSSMQAFMDAVKGDDVQAALDAYADVKANCGMGDSGGAEE